MDGSSRELQCVGKLEIAKPKPVGFLCGSIPVPTDKAFHSFSSALIPSRQTVSGAPRYRVLPTETDLNSPPHIPSSLEKVLPVSVAVQSRVDGDVSTVTSNLSRKCEALAVSGVVEYGDEIDVIAPADILKQVFKIPYSKARLSIAVQRIGQTLVLNPGPDVEEGEKFTRRHKNQTKSADQSLFLNFAMHSVRVEACDCPPTHRVPAQEAPASSVLPGVNAPQFVGKHDDIVQHDKSNSTSGYADSKQDGLLWGDKNNKRKKGHDPVKKVSQVGEKPRLMMQESEKHKRACNDGFLRVLFWQFHNFRMLLGSDLMLFSNEKYVAVSLHLWDITREITPLTWLEAWLDNVMASVPELAICYHQNGVVQGYELLKTDDIFLLKGISEDGTPAFHPYVVQQNGLSVLRFIQENCKQEPGAYWLYKSANEDVIQLFDLSAISKNHSSSDFNDCSSSMPSIVHKGRSDCLQSLGTLLYRIAHRLSLSMAPDNRAKCVKFIKKSLAFLEEPDHLIVRALAHEQFARLILNHDEDLELTSGAFPVDCEVTCSNGEQQFLYYLDNESDSDMCKYLSSTATENASLSEVGESPEDLVKDFPIKTTLEANASCPGEVTESGNTDFEDSIESESTSCEAETPTAFELSQTAAQLVQTVAHPVSSKLSAIHHVSQAIKSLREARQYQSNESEMEQNDKTPDTPMNPFVCACGDPDCIEVCDIREWLPTSKFDQKLWKLVLLLGESYLALGHTCKEDGQVIQALKAVELACSVYGSMPQQLDGSKFISSMTGCSPSREKIGREKENVRSYDGDTEPVISIPSNRLTCEQSSSAIFWAKAWTLVGDIFAENCMVKGNDSSKEEDKSCTLDLKVSPEVMEEVKRLEKRLGQYVQNCSLCSLLNCSCKSDRRSSGSSASSRSGNTISTAFGRKQNKRPFAKSKDNAGTIEATNSRVSSLKRRELRLSPEDKDGHGGIFKYLRSPLVGDVEYLLSVAASCYKEAKSALGGLSAGSEALQSVTKKIGWACNELGRYRLAKQELEKAEVAFADAIKAFREVSDHTNIILICCNLGHGRRALAEAMVSKIEDLKLHDIFHSPYVQAVESAKIEYGESLRYYEAAKSELNAAEEETGVVSSNLRTDVYTQFANTYLRLGMLLAKDVTAEVHGNGVGEDPGRRKTRKHTQKHAIFSASDAMNKALSVYESLGGLRRQEAAYACLHLASYQRDCCLKFLKASRSKGESYTLHQVKQFASLAERNWQKAADFYHPETQSHADIYLTTLIDRSALLLSLSSPLNSNEMLESALCVMLEGRNIPEAIFESLKVHSPEKHSKFWAQIQMVLKKMLSCAMSCSNASQSTPSTNISGDTRKLRELYAKSLKSSDFTHLNAIYSLWASS